MKLFKIIALVACLLLAACSGWLFGGYGIGNVITIALLAIIAVIAESCINDMYIEEEDEGFES